MQEVHARSRVWEYYEQHEADALGISYHYDWRQATEAGQWVLTDTGWVVPVYAVFAVKGRKISLGYSVVRIPTGTFLSTPTNQMTHERREDINSLSGKKPRYDDPQRALTGMERRFVQALIELGDVYLAYGQASTADPDKGSFRRSAQHMARRANVARAIDTATRDLLGELEVDKLWVLGKMKELIESKKTPGATVLKGLEKFAEYLEMEPQGDDHPWAGRAIFPGHSPEEAEKLVAENEARARELMSGDDESRRLHSEGDAETGAADEDVSGHGPVREDDLPTSPVQVDP